VEAGGAAGAETKAEPVGAGVETGEAAGARVETGEVAGARVETGEAAGARVETFEATGARVEAGGAAGAMVEAGGAAGAMVEAGGAAGARMEAGGAAGAKGGRRGEDGSGNADGSGVCEGGGGQCGWLGCDNICGCPSQRLTQALRQRRATAPPALQSAAPRPGRRHTAPHLRARLGECDEYPSPVLQGGELQLAHVAGPELPMDSSDLDVHRDTGQCGGYVEDAYPGALCRRPGSDRRASARRSR